MSENQLYLRGDLYYNTHKSSVFAILEHRSPQIESKFRKLHSFYFYPCKEFLTALFSISPSCTSEETASRIFFHFDAVKPKFLKGKSRIIIPETPFKLPVLLAEALIGGIYRESWKILYSPPLTDGLPEYATVLEVLKRIPNKEWMTYKPLIFALYDLLEDIRVISLGINKFPNADQKIQVLWEFNVQHDKIDLENPFPLKIILSMIRDIWLGTKESEVYKERMIFYEKKFPQLLTIVQSLEGLIARIHNCEDSWETLRVLFEVYYDLEMWFGNKRKENKESQQEEEEESEEKNPIEEEKEPEKESEEEKNQNEDETLLEETTETVGIQEEIEKEQGEQKEEEEIIENNIQGDIKNGNLEEIELSPDEDLLSQVNNLSQIFGVEDLIDKTYESVDMKCGSDEKIWEKSLPTQYINVKESRESINASYVDSLWMEVKSKCNFLINSLRRKIESSTMNRYFEGVPRGVSFSDQFITDTVIDLKANKKPMRAYREISESKEISTSAIILLDMSASMRENCEWLIQIALLLSWFLEKIGAKYSVVGFRNGMSSTSPDFEPSVSFFQYKDFRTNFNQLKVNLCHLITKLNGGTPTSDAMKLALDNLETRIEKRKLLFVITDGKPNTKDQLKQTKYLCRMGKENRIRTVGIGIGNESLPVTKLFENSAWSIDTSEINKEVFKILNKIL